MATKYIMTKEVILERVKQIIENQLLLEESAHQLQLPAK